MYTIKPHVQLHVCTAMQALTFGQVARYASTAARGTNEARVRRKEQDVAHDVSGQHGDNNRSMLLHMHTLECFGGRRLGLVKAVN